MGKFSRLGNDLYEGRVSIDFVGRRWLWYAISAVVIGVSVFGLAVQKLDMGIEFTGGAEFRVTLPADQVNQDTADQLREDIAATGVEAAASPVVTTSGTEAILIQTEELTDDDERDGRRQPSSTRPGPRRTTSPSPSSAPAGVARSRSDRRSD